MEKVLTSEEMRQVDRLTTERYAIPSILLMENAANAVVKEIQSRIAPIEKRSFLIISGPGNNGGDGAAVARLLSQRGANVLFALFAEKGKTTGDARINFDICEKLSQSVSGSALQLRYQEFNGENAFNDLKALLECRPAEFDCVIDALLGTGVSRPIDGTFAEVVEYLNSVRDPSTLFVSIDLPSGVCADRPQEAWPSFQADLTVTLTSPKPANLLPPACRFSKELVVADIGSPSVLIDELPSELYFTQASDAAIWLRQTGFSDDSYKNKRGHCYVIAGSEKFAGAAVLTAEAAMRSGVGLVTLMSARSMLPQLSTRLLPEIIVQGLDVDDEGFLSENAYSSASETLEKADAIAIGSGLSINDRTAKLVNSVVKNRKQPVLIDADALTMLSPFSLKGEAGRPIILTPHEGEFMRLIGSTDKTLIKDRVAKARKFALDHNVFLVLKGERTLIAAPDGRVAINPTGNSGLGKAGNGDTLAGLVAGFVAQSQVFELPLFETLAAAVYIAGLAGDIAEVNYGKRVMTASDVRECLADAFELLSSEVE